MKNITILTFFLFVTMLPSYLFGQDKNKTLLTITFYESFDTPYNKIIVIENDKKIEEVDLERIHYKSLDAHQIAINKILIKYRNLGYKIVSEICGTYPPTTMVTVYRLEKE